MPAGQTLTVLHYTGYDHDRGGLMTNIRNLAASGAFRCILGVNRGFRSVSSLVAAPLELPVVEPEVINLANFWRARRVAAEARVWLRHDPTRVFHGHSRAGMLVALWLRAMGESKVVVSVHCYGRRRWFYRAAKALLGSRLRWLTPAMQRYYQRDGAGDWSACVPNCIAGEPAETMRRWPGDRMLRIGGAGQLTANKRWDITLKAIGQLPGEARVEYFHAGGPTDDPGSLKYARGLEAFARARGIEDRVHWLGWQPSLTALLERVDVIVVPFKHEAFSFVALEALHAGVPVIAARGGGPDDFIIERVHGWLFDGDDPASLPELLQQLRQQPPWRGLRVERRHLERFSVGRVAAQWMQIYNAL